MSGNTVDIFRSYSMCDLQLSGSFIVLRNTEAQLGVCLQTVIASFMSSGLTIDQLQDLRVVAKPSTEVAVVPSHPVQVTLSWQHLACCAYCGIWRTLCAIASCFCFASVDATVVHGPGRNNLLQCHQGRMTYASLTVSAGMLSCSTAHAYVPCILCVA